MHEYDANDYADTTDDGSEPAGSDSGPLSDTSYAAYDAAGAAEDGEFVASFADGEEVDLDGDGVADGTATVTYDDLDGDGVADHATISIVADTDGDGTDETVVLINEYDTDQDGYSDVIDATYGADTDGDGAVDESSYASGTVEHSTTEDGSTTQSITWDDADAATYSQEVDSAYVDPATGEWVETTMTT